MVQERIRYTLWERGDVRGRSHSSSRTVGNPYDVNANRVPTSHQTLAVCSSLESGLTRWRWVVYAGVWLKTEAVGPTRWDRVVHAGVGLNTCVGLYTMAFGSKWRCWALTLAFGSKRRYWIIRTGVGPYIMALGCTRRCFLCRAWDNSGEKRSETHQIWALLPPSPATAWCWGLRQISDAALRGWSVQASLVSQYRGQWWTGEMEGPERGHTLGMLGRCREGYCRFSADMVHVSRGLQEGDRGWRMGAGKGIVDGGGREKRVVYWCVIPHSSRSPNWDVVRCRVRHTRCVQLTTMCTVSRMIFWGVCPSWYILTGKSGWLFPLYRKIFCGHGQWVCAAIFQSCIIYLQRWEVLFILISNNFPYYL